MSDDKVGYRNPPRANRFKPGVSGNPRGRPPRKNTPVDESIGSFLLEAINFREGDRVRTTTRQELAIRKIIDAAASGDLDAIENVLRAYRTSRNNNAVGAVTIELEGWWPTQPGQTAQERTRASAAATSSSPYQIRAIAAAPTANAPASTARDDSGPLPPPRRSEP